MIRTLGGVGPRRTRLIGAGRRQWLLRCVAYIALVALCLGLPGLIWAQNERPEGPDDLTAKGTVDGVLLAWYGPAQEAESVTGYRVSRRRPDASEPTWSRLVLDTGSAETSYLDADVVDGTRYIYRVAALHGSERSRWSNKAEIFYELTDQEGEPQVEVSFEQGTYRVAEGAAETIRVTLSADPEREVVIPLSTSNEGGATGDDYSGVPNTVTFNSGQTERSFALTATDDDVDDDGESVRISFGSALPAGVTRSTSSETTVSITDGDVPQVEVSFEQGTYRVAEGAAETIRVTLSADPEREVVVPLSISNEGGATGDDYSGVPDNLTFNSGQTVATFDIAATDDDVDDDGESVRISFGGDLPAGVSAGDTDEAIVSIADDAEEWTENELRPRELQATAEPGAVLLSWQPPVGDAKSVTGYEILRRRTNRGEPTLATLVADTGGTETEYVDESADEEGVIYAYRVKALRGEQASQWSARATATGIAGAGKRNQTQSADASLRALGVSPMDIIGFTWDRYSYEVGVDPSAEVATVSATANQAGAVVAYAPEDADDGTLGHQVELLAGRNEVTVTVTASNGNTTQDYIVSINRGVTDRPGWQAGADLDGLIAAGNEHPWGIWSDGTTLWVADEVDQKLYAYWLSNYSRNPSRDFDLAAESFTSANNGGPLGIWSDGTTMWVADIDDLKIYAYRLNDGEPDFNKEIDTLAPRQNLDPRGIWSDSTTMWVADHTESRVYAYRLSNGQRDANKEIILRDGNHAPGGIWSHGGILWVADVARDKLYAYRLTDKSRHPAQDINLAADNGAPRGIWSDGTIIWVADALDDKLYAYNLPQSDDASLSMLSVSPRDIMGFTANRYSYEVGVDPGVGVATVLATANNAGASVAYDTEDADDVTDGHQVALSAGRNEVTVTVTAADGNTTQDYSVSVNRGVTEPKGWKAGADLDGLIAAGNEYPYGIWSDGTTMWVIDSRFDGERIVKDDKLYAYRLYDGTRDAGEEFDLESTNGFPRGIWSDETTMWVVDEEHGKLYAYRLTDGSWDSAKDIGLASGNDKPRGIWSDGTTVWVADSGGDKLFAYTLVDGAPDAGRDINLAGGNNGAAGIWSDGTTIWVADDGPDKVFAYTLANGSRHSAKDFDTLRAAGNAGAAGIWSDGTTMWVLDWFDYKIYAYNMPAASARPNVSVNFGQSSYAVAEGGTVDVVVTLSADPERTVLVPVKATLQTGGATSDDFTIWSRIVRFNSGETSKTVTFTATSDSVNDHESVDLTFGNLPPGVSRGSITDTTVTLTDNSVSNDASLSMLSVSPRDIIGFTADRYSYEVGVDPGVGVATVLATANNAGASLAYETEDVDASTDGHQVALSAGRNLVTVTVTAADGNTTQDYSVSVNRGVTEPKGWQAGADLDGLITAGNDHAWGIWSDGATMWITDDGDGKLYAYRLSDGTRDAGKEFDLAPFVANPSGIWSDGTTIWVAELFHSRFYAHRLSDGTRDLGQEFDLPSYFYLTGIWSDGATMWVANPRQGDKIYAYTLSNGTPDAGKDINLVSENDSPYGIWSDGTTMWVTDTDDDKLFAYTLANGSRDSAKDFDLAAGNNGPVSIWSNGATMWVMDWGFQRGDQRPKAYAYNMPPASGIANVSVNFGHSSYAVAEGSTVDVVVTLSADPERTVLVPVKATLQPGGATSDDFTIWPRIVRFNSGETSKTVTFSATSYSVDGESVDLTVGNLPPGVTKGNLAETTVAITDNDVPGVTIDPAELEVLEGDFAGASYTVALNTQPSGEVTVAISGHTGTDLTLSGSTLSPNDELTFTVYNWDEAQTVKVKAGEDNDRADDEETISHEVTSGSASEYFGATISDVDVTITDNDVPGVTIDPAELEVLEGDFAGASYTVALNTQPSGDVTIAISGHAGTDLTLDKTELTFTVGNWYETQTVTVTAADDDDADHDADVILTHDISSDDDTDYDVLANRTVTVTITDDDTAFLVVNPTEMKINETGSDTFTVKLSEQPSDIVRVSVRSSDAGAATVWPARLNFDTSNWSAEQTVTVSGVVDNDIGDELVEVTLHANSADTDYDNKDGLVEVTVEDDDTAVLVVNPMEIDIVEGKSGTFTVSLTMQPSDIVRVSVGSSDAGAATVSPASLNFDTSNWSTNQTVTVFGVVDDDGFDESLEVTLSTASADTEYNRKSDSVTVSVSEASHDATLSGFTVSPRDIFGFTPDRYSYEVGVDPSVEVATVAATTNHAGAVVAYVPEIAVGGTDGHQVALSAGRNEVTVTVTAANGVTTQDYTVSINQGVTEPKGWRAGADLDGLIAAGNEGSSGIWSDGTTMWVADYSPRKLYAYRLTDGTRDTTKEFNLATANDYPQGIWSDGTTMWVVDFDDAKLYAYTLTDGTRDTTKEFNLADNDAPPHGIWSNRTTVWVLNAHPDAHVYAYTLSNGTRDTAKDIDIVNNFPYGIGSDGTTMWVGGSQGSGKLLAYRLTNGRRDEAKDIDLADVNSVPRGIWSDESTIWVGDSSDKVYAYNLPPSDDGTAGVAIDTTELEVLEGDTTGKNYTVELDTEPYGDVTVAISGHTGTDLRLSGATLSAADELTFTVDNWDEAQTVTVTAAEDGDAINDADVTLTHDISSAADTAYDALANQTVTVTITDDDTAGVAIDTTELEVLEGDTTGKNYTVELNTQPAGDVTVAISGHTGTDLTLDKTELTFSADNWYEAQAVTVTAADDDDADHDADVILTHDISSAADTAYNNLADRTVRVSGLRMLTWLSPNSKRKPISNITICPMGKTVKYSSNKRENHR